MNNRLKQYSVYTILFGLFLLVMALISTSFGVVVSWGSYNLYVLLISGCFLLLTHYIIKLVVFVQTILVIINVLYQDYIERTTQINPEPLFEISDEGEA